MRDAARLEEALRRLAACDARLPVHPGHDPRAPQDDGWTAVDALADPAAWPAIARDYAAGIDSERVAVGGSCALQGLAWRIAGLSIGAWALTGTVADLGPGRVHVRLQAGRTVGVAAPGVRPAAGAGAPAEAEAAAQAEAAAGAEVPAGAEAPAQAEAPAGAGAPATGTTPREAAAGTAPAERRQAPRATTPGPSARPAPAPDVRHDVDALARELLGRRLAPLVEASRTTSRISARVAWGNVASACASVLGLLDRALPPDRRPAWRSAAARLLDAPEWPARELVALTIVPTPDGDVLAHERATCCLMRLAPGKGPCGTCPRLDPEERRGRLAAAARERPPGPLVPLPDPVGAAR